MARASASLARAALASALLVASQGAAEPQLAWDPATLRLIERDGVYGRMSAAGARGWVFVCERGRGVWWRHRSAAGATWSESREVASRSGGKLANPELLALADGAMLCFFGLRPSAGSGAPYAILVARLEPGAEAWSAPSVLYEAGVERRSGCWEPAAVQAPSGEILLFFANEGPYRASDEQEISLMRSRDGGRTWGAAERAGFRAGHRDGMPVPVSLADGSGVAVAIEDNGLGGGTLKPAILFSPAADLWRSGAITGGHPGRWSALALPPKTYAGAPYLRQLPCGVTVLVFQRSDDGELSHSQIAAAVGDARAQAFSGAARPFPETPGKAQLWPALCVTGPRTICALACATIHGERGVWSIEGRLEKEDKR